jgi:putative transposase
MRHSVSSHRGVATAPRHACIRGVLAEPSYADEAVVRRVRHNGEIRWHNEFVYVNQALVGEPVGVFETAVGWLVRYGPVDLGWVDLQHGRLRRPTKAHRQSPPATPSA